MGLGLGIRDPDKTYSESRIRVQGSKRHRIPDPDPQHWYQCWGFGMFFPDAGSEFFHPGSRVQKIRDPESKRFRITDPHQRM